ncbi:MAG TPA: hypothetical protein VI142_08180 [Gaiellaceae bacterium]
MANSVAGTDSDTSTAYGDLGTVGPSITLPVPSTGRVLITVTAQMVGNASSTSCYMSFAASGANTISATDANAVILAAGSVQRSSATSVLSGLTLGSTTFTAKYRVTGGGAANCTFSNRSIMGIPLP